MRLFIGAGMPRGLWRRVDRRFAPARVLEFYAPTEGEAILVNLTGTKPGCKGRPLPGSAEVRLAAYEIAEGRLRERADGFAVECRPGEVGMLLTRLRGVVSTSESPLRGLFEPGDAWVATGDLFRADEDGDLWLVDHVTALIRTEHGFVASFPILDALGDLDAIDLAAVYGVPTGDPEASLAVAAVTLRPGFELGAGDLTARARRAGRRRAPRRRPCRRPDPGHHVVPAERRRAAGCRGARPRRGGLAAAGRGLRRLPRAGPAADRGYDQRRNRELKGRRIACRSLISGWPRRCSRSSRSSSSWSGSGS